MSLFGIFLWPVVMREVQHFSIWAHTTLLLLVLPLSVFFTFTVADLMLYWVITSILTQVLIYGTVEYRLGIFFDIVGNYQVTAAIIIALAFIGFSISFRLSDLNWSSVGAIVIVTIFFTLLAVFSTWKAYRIYVKSPPGSAA